MLLRFRAPDIDDSIWLHPKSVLGVVPLINRPGVTVLQLRYDRSVLALGTAEEIGQRIIDALDVSADEPASPDPEDEEPTSDVCRD